MISVQNYRINSTSPNFSFSVAHLFYVSNLLSLLRIVIIPFIFWGLLKRDYWLTFGLGGLGLMTDTFDGIIARRLNQQSDLGRLLDPIGDKLGILSTTLALIIMKSDFPLWAFFVLLCRDGAVFVLKYWQFQKTHRLQQSDPLGKITSWALALTLLLYLLKHWQLLQLPRWGTDISLLVGLSCALVSMAKYAYLCHRVQGIKETPIELKNDGGSLVQD